MACPISRRDHVREHELQRIDEEQHQEQQHAVQEDRQPILGVELAEERVVLDTRSSRPARTSARTARSRAGSAFSASKSVGHFERDDQQRQREAEHRVAEAFDARDLAAAAESSDAELTEVMIGVLGHQRAVLVVRQSAERRMLPSVAPGFTVATRFISSANAFFSSSSTAPWQRAISSGAVGAPFGIGR